MEMDAILPLLNWRSLVTATEQVIYADRVVQDPEIMVGKPVIKGTRIPWNESSRIWPTLTP